MLSHFPQPICELRNIFIVLRSVLFAILVYLNILTLGFAAWNMSVLNGLDVPVLGAPAFVAFNACFLLVLVICSLTAAWFSSRRIDIDQVRYECAWAGLLSVLQLASSVNVTVNGPPVLCQGVSVTACASSSLTAALSWLSCLIILLYTFSLLMSAITHMGNIPDIWTTSVLIVPWFVQSTGTSLEARTMHSDTPSRESTLLDIKRLSFRYPAPIFEKHAKGLPPSPLDPPTFPESPVSPPWWSSRRASVRSCHIPVERRSTWTSRLFNGTPLSHQPSIESLRPNWAKRGSGGRRGVDLPFAMPRFSFKPPPPVRPLRPLKLKSCWSQSTMSIPSPPPVPAVPPKAKKAGRSSPLDTLSPTSTFYIDLERDAVVPVGTHQQRPLSYEMFPQDVSDPDQPITRSRPSEWVRADSDSGSLKGSTK